MPQPSSGWTQNCIPTTKTKKLLEKKLISSRIVLEIYMFCQYQIRVLYIAHFCHAICKTDNRTVRHFDGLETMREIAVVVSHRFHCFDKIVLGMIINFKFKLIHYSNVTIIIAHKNINHKTGKNITILVIQLNEPWTKSYCRSIGTR